MRTFAMCLGFVLAGPVQGDRASEIARHVERLGSESAKVRAAARKALREIGVPAFEAMRKAANSELTDPVALISLLTDIGYMKRQVRVSQAGGLEAKAWRVAWRKAGPELAVVQFRGEARLFDGNLAAKQERLGQGVIHFAFDPTDKTFAFGTDNRVSITNRETGTSVGLKTTASQPGVAYSPDGRHVVTTGYAHEAQMWNVSDGTWVRKFTVRVDGGLRAQWSPDGRVLAIGNRNGNTFLFDPNSGDELHELQHRMSHGLEFSPDGKRLAIAYVDANIGVWNVQTGKLIKLLPTGLKEAYTVRWSPDGAMLATAGDHGPVTLWSAKHLVKLHDLVAGSDYVFDLAFRPDGKLLVAAGSQRLRTWKIAGSPVGRSRRR